MRSCGEKPVSPNAPFSSTVCRSARAELGFQSNSARSTRGDPAFARFARRPRAAAAPAAGRFTRRGWRARIVATWRVGVGHGCRRQPRSLEPASRASDTDRARRAAPESRARAVPSSVGVRIRFVIVAQQVEKSMHRQMGEMMVERLVLRLRLHAPPSRRQSRYRRAIHARPRRRLVPAETTAHWSACRCRAIAR